MSKHRTLITSTAALLLLGATALASSAAEAQTARRNRPATTRPASTTPPTTTPPTTTPAPTSVGAPTSFTVVSNIPDSFTIRIAPATQLGDAQLVNPTPGSSVFVSDNGTVVFYGTLENTAYTSRHRNKVWVPATSSFVFSPWVEFSFRTPTFDSLRPQAPQNVRVVERTATTVTVRWDATPTAARYDYRLNGGSPIQTGICGGAFCDPIDPLTATFSRPPVGATVSFSVTATRNEPGCGAYCFPDTRFSTSLASTLAITN